MNVLSHERHAVPLALFDPNGCARYTAKSNLLNEIEVNRTLILVQLLLISWQYHNLLIRGSSKDFLI